jgi:hypothetical protein
VLTHGELLSTDGLNTLTFGDPYAKLCFTTMITKALTYQSSNNQNKTHKRVLYIDTDTTFTAYLMAGLVLKNTDWIPNHKNIRSDHNNNNKSVVDNSNNENIIINSGNKDMDERLVQVFLPSEGRFESLLGDAIASMPEASIMIFDSLNSFYNMYSGPWYETEIIEERAIQKKGNNNETQGSSEQLWRLRASQRKEKNNNLLQPSHKSAKENGDGWSKPKSPYTTGRLNHLLSIFIMLLVQHGIYYKIPVLVTSMVRYKKVSEDLWVKAPACRRLLNQKSRVRLSVEMLNDNDLSVNIMKHPSLEQQTIVYPNVGISLLSP